MVAALCYDLNIVEGINQRIGSIDPQSIMVPEKLLTFSQPGRRILASA